MFASVLSAIHAKMPSNDTNRLGNAKLWPNLTRLFLWNVFVLYFFIPLLLYGYLYFVAVVAVLLLVITV